MVNDRHLAVAEGEGTMEKAIFAAGCFWRPEAIFTTVPGIIETEVGYTGGALERPSYEQVCTGTTGHAESVQVTFDPAKVSYESLVEKFFALHDPTQVNRQGPDIGSEYRSAIFYLSPEQERVARAVKERLDKSGQFVRPIATAIESAKTFWRAEDFHQKFIDKYGWRCHI